MYQEWFEKYNEIVNTSTYNPIYDEKQRQST